MECAGGEGRSCSALSFIAGNEEGVTDAICGVHFVRNVVAALSSPEEEIRSFTVERRMSEEVMVAFRRRRDLHCCRRCPLVAGRGKTEVHGQKTLRGFELELGNFFLVENENMINESTWTVQRGDNPHRLRGCQRPMCRCQRAAAPLNSGTWAAYVAVSELTAAHVPLCERPDSPQPMGRCQRAAAPLTARHGQSV
nr:hypothetical protein Iba_chr02aCG10140 [Ipomoea batatas]